MEVVDLAEVPSARYDAFLLGQPGAMLYHSTPYMTLLTDLLGCVQRGAVAIDGGEIVGAIPLMQMDGPHGRVINSLPFYGSHGGIVATSADACAALARRYRELVSEPGLAAATVIGTPLEPFGSLDGITGDLTDARIGQLTSLDATKAAHEGLMDSIHSKTRNMVRKAASTGVEVAVDGTALGELAAIHADNMATIGGRPKPDEFFDLVPRRFAEGREWAVFTGRLRGEVVAALLVFYFNGIAEYFTPAVREEHRSSQALSLVVFEAIRDAARRGMRWWNWGGTWSSQESVHRFKSRWGTVDLPYEYRTTVVDRRLLDLSADDLLRSYPFFYVLPFGALHG